MVLTTLSEESFKELMRLATSGVEFCFDDVVYCQVDGFAMGSPLGPALANMCVGYYERRIPDNEFPQCTLASFMMCPLMLSTKEEV